MVSAEYVKKLVDKIKKQISKSISKGKYEDALSLISICADILYHTNICYMDNDLEKMVCDISNRLNVNYTDKLEYEANDDCILFYDGFGLNERGLIQIYLKALCKLKKVVYVTYDDRKELIPDVQDILSLHGCEIRYIIRNKKTFIEQIDQLNEIMKEIHPGKMFFYSVPWDVVATTLMYAYENLLKRYQINLTDHAFWLGTECIDKCIEFRNYGAKISNEYRKIDKNKIVIIPFYPVVHKEKIFQGFPFEKRKYQKVVFSGGALYKTLSEDNKYYKMVEKILEDHSDVVFWYAGSGDDSEMKKLIKRFPQRAFLTAERSDLLQVLEHSDVYLSTYPVPGGLMFQYAAIAGCVPVTLKNGNISDDFLINQSNINIEFNDEKKLYEEVDNLLTDDKYSIDRKELMKKSVISQEIFDREVENLILEKQQIAFPAKFEHIDTDDFRKVYLKRVTKADVDALLVHKNVVRLVIGHYPLRFFRGGIHIAKRMLL